MTTPHLAAARLNNSSADRQYVVRCHGIAKTPKGEFIMVLDYASGGDSSRLFQTLHDKKAPQPLMQHVQCKLLREMGETLQLLHETDEGVIHRDIKAENFFINAAGRPILGDFGNATLGTSKTSYRAGVISPKFASLD